jgi:uncharacterized protein (TIGR02246 family)
MRFLVVTWMVMAAAMTLSSPVVPTAPQLSNADREAVIRVTREYRDAWLANDAERVMATLDPEAVLLPSSMNPIEGAAAIRKFWFGPGPPTTVTAMEQEVRRVTGAGDVAVVRGQGSLTFRIGDNAPVTQHSWFLNVLRRQRDRRWLIVERAWSDRRR